MSNPLMEKMLDLPEFEVTDFKQNDNDMGFYVETKKRPTFCPVCVCYYLFDYRTSQVYYSSFLALSQVVFIMFVLKTNKY